MKDSGPAIGSYVPDFELPGVDGSVHHLARYLENVRVVCVVFMGNHCPTVHAYLDRLNQLQIDFAAQGFTLVGINANDAEQAPEEGLEAMQQFATAQALQFPYLRDVTQEVALGFGAQTTPHAFLVDQGGKLCYAGAIDDDPQTPNAVQTPYLRMAITALLQQHAIAIPLSDPVGCPIKWKR
jgi:peroxiredoxin